MRNKEIKKINSKELIMLKKIKVKPYQHKRKKKLVVVTLV